MLSWGDMVNRKEWNLDLSWFARRPVGIAVLSSRLSDLGLGAYDDDDIPRMVKDWNNFWYINTHNPMVAGESLRSLSRSLLKLSVDSTDRCLLVTMHQKLQDAGILTTVCCVTVLSVSTSSYSNKYNPPLKQSLGVP